MRFLNDRSCALIAYMGATKESIMSFMDAYKRLDNLCKTFKDYPNGISSYIEEMEKCTITRYQGATWEKDYKN